MNDVCPGYISLRVCQGDPSLRSIISFFKVSDIASFVEFRPKDSSFLNGCSSVTIEQGGNKATPSYFIVEEPVDEIARKITRSKYCEQFGLQIVDLE